MWFECLLFQMVLFLLLAIGISWAKAEKFLYMTLMLISSYNNGAKLCFFLPFSLRFFFPPLTILLLYALLPVAAVDGHATHRWPHRKAVSHDHISVTTNRARRGVSWGAQDEGFTGGLPAGACSTRTSCCHPLQST